jgi:asparagine synthase (glutamine-hydrolysing)
MCGINCINRNDKEKILAMNKTIAHRGPDQQGIHTDRHVSLGHVRLSILDLSEKGRQPMEYKNLKIIYNGEVYNFKELRSELGKKGLTFNSQTDTEVILKGYAQEGEQFLKKLNGIFAFVLYDKDKKTLSFMRDRLGIKPLYYYHDGERLIISSEIKTFIENFREEIDFTEDCCVIKEFLTNGCIPQESFIKNVTTAKPGEMLRYDLVKKKLTSNILINIYDDVTPARYAKNREKTEEELVDELDAILNRVVKRQMISDAPVGTICSGGLDSSLVTAIATKHNPDMKVYNIKVEEKKLDESKYAKIVADHLGLRFSVQKMNKKVYLDNYKECTYYCDSPLLYGNSVGVMLIARKAREDKIKVLLSGEGADELFGGYGWYRQLYQLLNLHDLNVLKKIKGGWVVPYLFLQNKQAVVDHYTNYRNVNNEFPEHHNRVKKLVKRLEKKLPYIKNRNERTAHAFLLADMQHHLIGLLKRADRMSMMHSVETRVPFLDNELLEFAFNLPFKYKNGKNLLKKVAERYLPKEIVHRRKVGFEMPYAKWLNVSDCNYAFFREWQETFSRMTR